MIDAAWYTHCMEGSVPSCAVGIAQCRLMDHHQATIVDRFTALRVCAEVDVSEGEKTKQNNKTSDSCS